VRGSGCRGQQLPEAAFSYDERNGTGLIWMIWSKLNSLLPGDAALCSHDSQTQTGPGGSLSYVRCQARRKV
jgi:hypothetical protein